jgi:S-adenosylmethionine/arginine decarboxylase-like enzyme
MTHLVHEHFFGRFEVKKPPKHRDGSALALWITRLIDHIGMERLNGPHLSYVSDPGNVGWTAVCIIKTSHMAIHVWEEIGVIQVDCYSCSTLDPERVIEMMAEFEPTEWEWYFYDRDKPMRLLRTGGGEKPASVKWGGA